MVQTRWTHLNRDYSFLTQVEAILLDGHFVLEHGARARTGVFFNFNGTAGMWRTLRHRSGRRLAARYPHRGHRPQLPRADHRMEIQVPPGRRVSRRGPHRDDRLQDPAAALGQRPHPDLEENSAPPLPLRRSPAREDRSLVSPHRQPQLPAHGRAVGAADAGHDHPLLSGVVGDALYRLPPLRRFDAFRSRRSISSRKRSCSRAAGTSACSICRS